MGTIFAGMLPQHRTEVKPFLKISVLKNRSCYKCGENNYIADHLLIQTSHLPQVKICQVKTKTKKLTTAQISNLLQQNMK